MEFAGWDVAHERCLTPRRTACSAFNGRQIESLETLGIGQDIHLDDPSAGNREADHGKQLAVGPTLQEPDIAIHEDHLIGQAESRERRGLPGDGLGPSHDP
jgi:hypothetical protein